MAKEHAIQAAQEELSSLGIREEVVDVQLVRVGRVLVVLKDGRSITVDRWTAAKLRTVLQHRFPRHRLKA